jgi:hypothetical protein
MSKEEYEEAVRTLCELISAHVNEASPATETIRT